MTGSSFIESTPLDITESIPTSISARTGAGVYVNKTIKADVSINEMAFQFAIDDTNTYERETADFRRQQIDTSKEPGEQSLNQWWVRDQNSWHHGMGVNFYEPGTVDTSEYRYNRSIGVDVWTEGQATLLHSSQIQVAATSGQSCFVTSAVVNGADCYFQSVNGVLSRSNGTTTSTYTGSVALSSAPAVSGAKVLVGGTAGIWSGDVGGNTVTNLWTTGSIAPVNVYWVKSRIIATQGPKIWDLTLAGGSLDSTTPLYTHPSTSWTWSGVADAPGAIVASGYDSGYGYIYKFSLTDGVAGSTPTLGSAVLLADFPPGEQVYAIKSYLSTYLAIGTSSGLRIGQVTTTLAGIVQLQYGPLIILTSNPVRCLSARDRFVYAGIEGDLDGNSGLLRVDLSAEIGDSTQRYAYAFDANAHVPGQVQSVSFLGVSNRVVFGVLGVGVFLQSATLYEPSGYILSGKIRYGTSEPKTFNLLKFRGSIPDGDGVSIDTVDQTANDTFLIRLTSAWNTDEDLTLRSLADSPQAYASFKMTLDSGSTFLTTPLIQSMQIKGTPQPRIQRNIKFPLRLIDVEQDRNGVKLGKAGSAAARLQMIEDMEQDHSVVLVTDYTSGETFTAQIRSVQFIRDTPTSRNRANFGGILNVTVLKL